jgi:hypothetical protein
MGGRFVENIEYRISNTDFRSGFNIGRKIIVVLIVLFISGMGFSQTKTELQAKIDQQTKTIDSLKAIVANNENVIETRDRSIKFLQEDKVELNKKLEEQTNVVRAKNTEIAGLRAQNATGVAKKVTLTNTKSSMTVPAGKHWVINQFIGDYLSPPTTDSTGAVIPGSEIFVFLKTLNGETLTDPAQGKYGPLLYSSMTPYQTILYPLILTEGTSFSIVVYKGSVGALLQYEGGVVCSYWEK